MSRDLVFITGASGFIGAHVAREFIASGYGVRALAHAPHGVPRDAQPGIDRSRAPSAATQPTAKCKVAVTWSTVRRSIPLHREIALRSHSVNVAGTASVLEPARTAGVERAVVTSSAATVGPAHQGVPATEAGHPRETRMPRPITARRSSKSRPSSPQIFRQ